jgi:hypothetical protein
MIRFYGHFAAAYGSIWFGLMICAVVSQSRINTGEFGLYGFPILALLYAIFRCLGSDSPEYRIEMLQMRIRTLEAQLEQRADS